MSSRLGEPVTGLVLAGGQGSRLGGADKGLVDWRGRPLVAHVLERLRPQVDQIIINANRNLDAYRAYGCPVVVDSLGGYAGPLAGLAAGLAACATPLLACVPCDAPALPADLIARLRAGLEAGTATVAAARAGERLQPTFILCHRSVLPRLEAWLAAGGRKVGAWLADMGAVPVPFDDPADFANFNKAADFQP